MYHLHDEKSEKNRNRSDENSGEMIDDLLDDGIDFDGLPPVMKVSDTIPSCYITSLPLTFDLQTSMLVSDIRAFVKVDHELFLL